MQHQLPIVEHLNAITDKLHDGNVILSAAPGAGKSTALILHLLLNFKSRGKIVVLQPRRVVVRALAAFLAEQLGESVGDRVGYQIRGERKTSRHTRLEFITEGILANRFLSDPELSDTALLVFDEFHERNLHSDFGLALALEVQQALRDDLRLLIMSATMATDELARLLPEAELVSVDGRQYPIVYHYQPINCQPLDENGLVNIIVSACHTTEGDVLVFLSGQRDIERVKATLESHAAIVEQDISVYPLYGALSRQRQHQAVAPSIAGKRKIVLATNIAETSLTIDGISVVIDTGLEKVGQLDLRSGIERLVTRRISQASATQRAGRAGRTQNGVCYRLWDREHQQRMNERHPPEIVTRDIVDLQLQSAAWGSRLAELPLITQPTPAQLHASTAVLQALSAIDNNQRITAHGKRLAEAPLNIRLSHMLSAVQREHDGQHDWLCAAAFVGALLTEKPILRNGRVSDGLVLLKDENHVVAKTYKRLLRYLGSDKTGTSIKVITPQQIAVCIAVAMPDWIAKWQSGLTYKLVNGKQVSLSEHYAGSPPEWLAIADLYAQHSGNIVISAYESLEAEWVHTYYKDSIEQKLTLNWLDDKKQFKLEQQLRLGKLAIKTQNADRQSLSRSERQSLLTKAWQGLIQRKGFEWLPIDDKAQQFIYRVETAKALKIKPPSDSLPAFDSATLIEELASWLLPFIGDKTRFSELMQLDWLTMLQSRLEWSSLQWLESVLPTKIELPSGDKLSLTYNPLQRDHSEPVIAPTVSARMQWFYGWSDTPSVAEGKLPLRVELLSPAHRPLQLTADLGAFWRSDSYRQIQKEMKGRYPKHLWPDDPANTAPTKVIKRKM